jgi:sulfite reductase beta subunit-like hemoprotein
LLKLRDRSYPHIASPTENEKVMKLVSDITNFGWKYNVRESDLQYRKVILERWSVDDGRRSVDEKMEQLKV